MTGLRNSILSMARLPVLDAAVRVAVRPPRVSVVVDPAVTRPAVAPHPLGAPTLHRRDQAQILYRLEKVYRIHGFLG